MVRNRSGYVSVLLFLVAVAAVSGQDSRVYEPVKSKYAGYNAVVLDQEMDYVFDIDKDSLRVTQHTSRDVLVLNDNSRAFTDDFIYYGSFSKVSDMEAYTRIPDGDRYRKIPVTHFTEAHDRDGQIFYDDSKSVRFAYPSVREGAITTVGYTINFSNPHFLNRGYFQSYIPVVKSRVTAKVNRDVKLGYKLVNGDKADIKFDHYSRGKYDYYSWEVNDLKPYKYAGSSHYNVSHYSPHIILYVESVTTGGKTESYFSDVQHLYTFYYSLLSEMNNDSSPDLDSLVYRITSGLTDRDKARAILYWVQENIKYVAYSEGYMGFIPVAPTEVFNKRYGDCKGMSALIHKMLQISGLETCLAWVGTRSIPYKYNDVPLPCTDNHMVAIYMKDDTTFVLDGTFKYLDFGMYPFHIQGKEILISVDPETYRLFNVPVSSPDASTVCDSVSVTFDGSTITGAGRRIHTGFNRYELASAMDGVREADYREKLTTLFMKGNNKFRVDTYNVESLFEHDRPAVVDYTFTLDDYARVAGDEIYLNMNLDRSYQNMKIDTSVVFSPVINDFTFTETHITRLEIPEGYEVSYLPEDDTISNDELLITWHYKADGSSVILEKRVVFNFLLLGNDKISEWNDVINRLNRNYRLSLVLRKTK